MSLQSPRWKVLFGIIPLSSPLLAEPTLSMQAVKCDPPPVVVDGKLDEGAWTLAPVIHDLIVVQPANR